MIRKKIQLLLFIVLPVFAGAQDFSPKMVDVNGGSFEMGSMDGADNEKPVHTVKLNDFAIGKYEVTQKEWESVMGKNPSIHKNCEKCPVENVTFEDVQTFLEKVNKLTGKRYRLPTEAEWEYAAKGGNSSMKYKFSGGDDINKVGWIITNSNGETKQVGKKKANELGIYDMSGNAWEWVSDYYAADYYLNSPAENPAGPVKGKIRIVRGGSCLYNSMYSRTSYRMLISPRNPHHNYGFRLALSN